MRMQDAIDTATRKARKHELAKQTKIQRCYEILCAAADAGKPCPSNQDLCDMLDYATPAKASGVVSLLGTMGLITVQRGQSHRVVTIVKSGKRTAGVVVKRRSTDWTEDQDEILMDGIAEGEGFTAVGRIIGKSRAACVSRFNKIAARMGDQAQ